LASGRGGRLLRCDRGYGAKQGVIRAAQRSLIDPANGILAGPDTDLIKDRYDGSHMGDTGLRQHAEAWLPVLMASAGRRASAVRQAQ
jgi:hypothetical protein